MDEEQWLSSTDPTAMLALLRGSGRASERKLRLFAVACCRRVWHLFADEQSRRAVEVAERFADGRALEVDLGTACQSALDTAIDDPADYAAAHTAEANAAGAASLSSSFLLEPPFPATLRPPRYAEAAALAALLRDIFGNPFRPVALDPAWLTWNEGAAVSLLQTVYDDRDLPSGYLDAARLALLADILEAAGATDAQLLSHLRSPGPHVRGCFAVDAVLGKT